MDVLVERRQHESGSASFGISRVLSAIKKMPLSGIPVSDPHRREARARRYNTPSATPALCARRRSIRVGAHREMDTSHSMPAAKRAGFSRPKMLRAGRGQCHTRDGMLPWSDRTFGKGRLSETHLCRTTFPRMNDSRLSLRCWPASPCKISSTVLACHLVLDAAGEQRQLQLRPGTPSTRSPSF
jgi:hypothetical protein